MSNVLDTGQDTSRPCPEGQLPGSYARDGAKKGHQYMIERAEKRTPSSRSDSKPSPPIYLLEPLLVHGPGCSAMPLPHTIQDGAGITASSCSLNSMA